jgi:hypothetical protein
MNFLGGNYDRMYRVDSYFNLPGDINKTVKENAAFFAELTRGKQVEVRDVKLGGNNWPVRGYSENETSGSIKRGTCGRYSRTYDIRHLKSQIICSSIITFFEKYF